jgi:hypothetical protein
LGGQTGQPFALTYAEALDVDVETVEHCVEGLAHLFTESAKYGPASAPFPIAPSRLSLRPALPFAVHAHRTRITEIDFLDSLMLLSFPQELTEKLKEVIHRFTPIARRPFSLSRLTVVRGAISSTSAITLRFEG